jgi:hypothetical protein
MKWKLLFPVVGLVVAAAPHVAEARGCSESSEIVGYHRCTRFGDTWSTEAGIGFEAEIGIGYMTLDPSGRTISGTFGKGQAGSYDYAGALVGHGMSALPLNIRFGYAITAWLYAGAEMDIGAGADRLPATETKGYSVAASSHGINAFGMGGGAYAGLRLPLSYFALRGETLFGGRAIGVNQTATGGGFGARPATSTVATGVVEPRFFADFWIAPYATMSIYAGFDALKLKDRVGGLMIGIHGKAYNGGFAAW